VDLGLTGKVAVVTGASKGIGLAITRALVQEGVNVIAGARDTTDELTTLTDGGQVHYVNVDLSSVIDYSAAKA
jgi:NAD(P)-dependent dehydrogenase (short-subunit alcohol dehydrogenase family)